MFLAEHAARICKTFRKIQVVGLVCNRLVVGFADGIIGKASVDPLFGKLVAGQHRWTMVDHLQ